MILDYPSYNDISFINPLQWINQTFLLTLFKTGKIMLKRKKKKKEKLILFFK